MFTSQPINRQQGDHQGLSTPRGQHRHDQPGHDQADVGATSFERDHELTVLARERETLVQIERALAHMVKQLRDPEAFLRKVQELYASPETDQLAEATKKLTDTVASNKEVQGKLTAAFEELDLRVVSQYRERFPGAVIGYSGQMDDCVRGNGRASSCQ